MPVADLAALVCTGEPQVFRMGTATVLGEFRLTSTRLQLELAQIEGGGEGVLLTLGALARRFAQQNGLHEVEWVVHAVHCAQPNEKLRRVLTRRGFVRTAEAYYLVEPAA